jgi:hypothetical protein
VLAHNNPNESVLGNLKGIDHSNRARSAPRCSEPPRNAAFPVD